ncbi:MAG: hypothetical protein GX434_04845 [Peptococcaceae bacterium]|nr:hypothetical protein [Peptococcaceae bacterium]
MTRRIYLIFILFYICFTLTACNKEKELPVQKSNPEIPVSQDFVLHDEIASDGFNYHSKGAEWARAWLERTYADYGLTGIEVSYESSAVFDQLSEGFDIRPTLYSIQFASQKPFQGAIKNEKKYKIKVMEVVVFEKGKIILSGLLGPTQFNEYSALQEIYNVVSKDKRFSSRLKPFPKFDLPNNFSLIDMSQITNGRNSYTEHFLPGEIIAAVCTTPVDGENYSLEVSFYDLVKNKTLGTISIGTYSSHNSKVEEGNILLYTWKNGSSNPTIVRIDPQKNITREESSENKAFVRYSPDRNQYAYSNQGSLYVADVKGQYPPKLLIKGNASQGQDRMYYYPFAWYGNSMIVYGVGGYEWSNGCGVVDIPAGRDTLFEQAGRFALPIAIRENKLFAVNGDMGAPFDPVEIDLSAPLFPARKIITDDGFKERLKQASFAFSPDGKKIAVLDFSDTQNEKYHLYICSASDGSLLKEYQFRTVFSSAQNVDFVNDHLLAISSQRYAFSAKYLYLVNLE